MPRNPLHVPVDEYTTPEPSTVRAETPLEEIHKLMRERDIRHLPVVEPDGRPIGVISERDVNLLSHHAGEKSLVARDVMTPGPYTCGPETPLEKVAFDMSKYKIGSAIVVDEGGRVSGIFTSTDALNALIEIVRGEVDED